MNMYTQNNVFLMLGVYCGQQRAQCCQTTAMVLSEGHWTSLFENDYFIIFCLNLWLYLINVSGSARGCPSEGSLGTLTSACHCCWGMGLKGGGIASISSQSVLQPTGWYNPYIFGKEDNPHGIASIPFTEIMFLVLLVQK